MVTPIFNPTIHPLDPEQCSSPPADTPDIKGMGVNFFQILAIA
jgi:hypothetical protein